MRSETGGVVDGGAAAVACAATGGPAGRRRAAAKRNGQANLPESVGIMEILSLVQSERVPVRGRNARAVAKARAGETRGLFVLTLEEEEEVGGLRTGRPRAPGGAGPGRGK